MAPSIPGSFAEVTAAWLAEVLGAPIERIAVEPLTGAEAGFLGDVARVRIELGDPDDGPARSGSPASDPDLPRSVIVKLPPTDAGGRQVGRLLNVWAREQAFYHEVAPASWDLSVPDCHLAAGDHDRDRWVLVLEDRPSEPLDPVRGATLAQVEAAVDALAVFHARWWEAERRFEWMPGFDGAGVGGLAPVWADAIPLFLERYGHLIPDDTDRWLTTAPDWLPGWSERVGTEPLTIIHADYRLDNLRFHRGRMTMIDWQTALRGPGTMDLASFLITACTIDDRRRWEPALLERYRLAIERGGAGLDRGWLATSYDENLVWWMAQFANNLAMLEPDDPGAQARLDTTIERTFAAAADHDVGRLLPI